MPSSGNSGGSRSSSAGGSSGKELAGLDLHALASADLPEHHHGEPEATALPVAGQLA